MKTPVKLSLVAIAILAAVVLFTGTVTAYADGPRGGWGGRMGMGGPDESLVAVAAKTLGLTQADLVTALQGGKTIAAVAKEKGVALDKIVDAFVAERQDAFKAAVASGRMTQAQVDSMISLMKTNVLARLNQPFTPRGFVDANKDGVCDNCGMGGTGGMGRMGRAGMRPQGGPRPGR
jgi:hypothetical protein